MSLLVSSLIAALLAFDSPKPIDPLQKEAVSVAMIKLLMAQLNVARAKEAAEEAVRRAELAESKAASEYAELRGRLQMEHDAQGCDIAYEDKSWICK